MIKTNKKNNEHTNSYDFFTLGYYLKKRFCATLINYSANTDSKIFISLFL